MDKNTDLDLLKSAFIIKLEDLMDRVSTPEIEDSKVGCAWKAGYRAGVFEACVAIDEIIEEEKD